MQKQIHDTGESLSNVLCIIDILSLEIFIPGLIVPIDPEITNEGVMFTRKMNINDNNQIFPHAGNGRNTNVICVVC